MCPHLQYTKNTISFFKHDTADDEIISGIAANFDTYNYLSLEIHFTVTINKLVNLFLINNYIFL